MNHHDNITTAKEEKKNPTTGPKKTYFWLVQYLEDFGNKH